MDSNDIWYGCDPIIIEGVIALGLRKLLENVCLFVLSRTSNFSAIWRLSPLPVTGLQI
jgi:hypothetical protein